MDLHSVSEFLNQTKWTLAGFFGAMAASFFHRDELNNKRDFALFFISGWACAYFLSGLVAQKFSIDPENMGAIGFLLGAFGGSFISAVIRMLRTADLWEIVRKKFGGGS